MVLIFSKVIAVIIMAVGTLGDKEVALTLQL